MQIYEGASHTQIFSDGRTCFFIATINLAFEPSRCIIVDNDRVLEDDLSYNKLDP